MKKGIILLLAVLLLLPILACTGGEETKIEAKKPKATRLVFGCGREGTYGYIYTVAMARVINKHLNDITVDTVSRQGYTTVAKIVAEGKGEIDMVSVSSGSLGEMYNQIGAYKGVKLDYAPTFTFTHSLTI